MTVAELYQCDDTTRLLIDLWVEERRCPLVLVDRLMEMGLDNAADCAQWAAKTPNRPIYFPEKDEKKSPCGPYPTLCATGWFFMPDDWGVTPPYASTVPIANIASKLLITSMGNCYTYPTPLDAILILLNNWKPAPVKATQEPATSLDSSQTAI